MSCWSRCRPTEARFPCAECNTLHDPKRTNAAQRPSASQPTRHYPTLDVLSTIGSTSTSGVRGDYCFAVTDATTIVSPVTSPVIVAIIPANSFSSAFKSSLEVSSL